MPQRLLSTLARYGCALVTVALAITSRLLLDPVLGLQFPFLTILLAIVVTAWCGGIRPALAAVVVGALAVDFFLLPPRWIFGLTGSDQQIGMVLYLITGLGIALLAGSMHHAQQALREAKQVLASRVAVPPDTPRAAVDFRLLFESAPGMYLVLATDFRIVAASDAYLRATMTERQQIEGQGIFEVFPDNPTDSAATGVRNLRASLERVMQLRVADAMAVQKYDVLRPESAGGGFEERFWSPVNTPAFGRDNQIVYIIHRVDDVTAFVRQEEARTRAAPLSRRESMEAEIVLRGQQVQEANQRLRVVNEQLRLLQNQLEQRVGERTRELTEANEKLRASEERSRLMVQGVSSHAIFMLDPAGIVTNWNPGAERIKGYQAEEIVGQHFSRFYTPEDVASGQPQLALQTAVEQGSFEEEGLRVRKDGSRFWAVVTITPIYDRTPLPIGFVNVTRDITKRKELMTALTEASRFNRATLDGLSAHIAILDEDGAIIAVNKPWEDFATANGLASGAASIGANYLAVCDRSAGPYSEESAVVAAGIRAVLGGEIPQFEAEYPCDSPNQKRWFIVRITPFPGEGLRRVIVAHENITERKQSEKAIQDSQERLLVVIENMNEGAVICDLAGQMLHWNRAAVEMHGFTSSEEWRRGLPEFFDLFELSTIDGQVLTFEAWPMARLLRGERFRDYELRVRRTELDWDRIFSYGGDVVIDAVGRQVAFLTVMDITERKRAEEALRASEERLRLMIEGVSDHAIFMLDPGGHILT
ncbi:MAG: PAS domain S-box protein [Planctomycetia bacterium]|nr:PAS domain S-box protein [Planctomycetia bacterium]